MRITATWLNSRQEPKGRPSTRQDVNVDGREGLVVRLSPSGAISFRFRYQKAGKRRWLVLGDYGDNALSLAEAFDRHRQAQRDLERGLDPIEERDRRLAEAEKARQDKTSAGTIAEVVEQFVHRKLGAERWDADQAAWVRDAKVKTRPRKRPDAAAAVLKGNLVNAKLDGQTVGRLKAQDLTRRQLVRLLDAIVDRGAPVSANRTFALCKQLFEWAASKDIIPASPMAGVERPGGEEMPRSRVLNAEEIARFWSKVGSANMVTATGLALKILLATGQRRGEITHAEWSHFDFEQKTWTIPVELLKSSHARRSQPEPHVVPLSPLALELLAEMRLLTGKGRYVLPAHADQTKDRPYSERVLSRAVRQNADHFEIPHFTPHDLRRTAASFMTKIGVPRLHVEKVLNHSTGDIAEVYDRHDYLAEKKAALEKWGVHLLALVTEKNAANAVALVPA